MKTTFTIIAFVCFSLAAQATHLLGGYITYRHIANQLYEIQLIIYRDCNSATPFDGTPGAQGPAVLGVFESNGSLETLIELTNPQISLVPVYDTVCAAQAAFCMERGIYTTTFNLPNPGIAYTLVHERCCFGGQISNLYDGANVGIAFSASLPALNAGTNSCPVFDSVPNNYVPVNDSMHFYYGATDPDGDSLVYSFGTLNIGGNSTNPAPNPPLGPPYNPVTWLSGYSANSIFGNSSVQIDTSGMVTALPTQVGVYVAGIHIKEYRNNQLLNTNTRMVTFWVDGCFPNAVKETDVAQIRVFPNPATDRLTIELTEAGFNKLEVVNTCGQAVKSFNEEGHSKTFSINDLPAGCYLVAITTAKGEHYTQRIWHTAE